MKKRILLPLAFFLVLNNFVAVPSLALDAPAVKPIIGINTDIDGENPETSSTNCQYIDAIKKAGGIPVLLPPMAAEDLRSLLPQLDGVMMIGGADYPPSLYKQEQHKSVSLMKDSRTNFDLALAKAVLADNEIPFLGICAGCQALNIVAGGSLVQDIPSMKPESQVKHASPQGWKVGFNKHQVEVNKDSKLAKALNATSLEVVTSHHQCVGNPGKDFSVIAKAPDGVVEGIEKSGERFVLGVQWHPERDYETNKSLFAEFVRQAARHHSEKAKQK